MGVVQDGLVLWLDARAQRQLIKMGQSDSVWKDLSGNGNDCEVHREVFEYPPVLEGGRNLAFIQDYSHDNQYQTVTKTNVTFNGQPVYRAIKKTISTPPTRIGSITIRKGETFTASIWIKHEQQPTMEPARLIFYKNTTLKVVYAKNNYGEWERLIVTYTNDTDADIENVSINFYPARGAGEVTYFTCPKIEKGPVATPWTPAPEDLGLEYPDWVQNFYPGLKDRWYENKLYFINSDSHIQIPEINLNPDNFTIQIDNRIRVFNGDKVITENGDEWGRNLLPNSNFVNGIENWTRNQNVSLSIVDKKLKVIFNQETSTPGVKTLKNLVLPTGTYTISAKVKGSYKGLPFFFYAGSSLLSKIVYLTGEWEVVTRTIDLIEPLDYQFMMLTMMPRLESYFLIDWIKIEKGSQATPWTPAPEDITGTNIINRNTPFVENNTIHTLRFYNRALTDEEILQNYRATHFLLEPKTFTSNDYYNYYDLNRVEINTLATKDLAEVLRGDINLEDIDFDRDMKSIPFADVLNRVEGNINILGNKLYKPKGWTQPKLDWGYNQPFSYEDANRLEKNLLLLYNYAKGNIDKIPYCGMYICGEEVI